MGSVTSIRREASTITVEAACERFLVHVRQGKSTRTYQAYTLTLAKFCDEFGAQDLAQLDPDRVAGWFAGRWGKGSAQGWNTNRAALTSAAAWWQSQPDMPSSDPFVRLSRRGTPPDRSRALDRAVIDRLITNPRIPLRERCLWSLLYDSAARSAEVLRLNVEDLDLVSHKAKVTRKGGATDVIIWDKRTARLLPNYLQGRTEGPVFVTEVKAMSNANIGPADLTEDGRGRLSYELAEQLFKKHSGGATLHQLRHSSLTHASEDGASVPLLMTKSGHVSIRSLGRYARPSVEALQRWEQERNRYGRS